MLLFLSSSSVIMSLGTTTAVLSALQSDEREPDVWDFVARINFDRWRRTRRVT